MVLFVDLNGVRRADFMAAVTTNAYLFVNDDTFPLKVQCMNRTYIDAFAALDARVSEENRGLALSFHLPADIFAEEEWSDEGEEEIRLFLLGDRKSVV